jgi:hypothetical protein
MTTSGTSTFNPTRDVIIRRALRMVGGYASSGSPRPEQITDANDVLNLMLKSWQMDSLLWLRVFATLFLNKGQAKYNLAPTTHTGFSHCATSYVQTTTSAAAIAGAGSVTLTSATGITTGDYIGVVDNNGLIEWSTVTILGLTATLSTVLTAAVASGNVVYSHTVASQVSRPTRIFSAVRKLYDTTAANGYEVPIYLVARTDYENLPNKTTQGKVINLYYDPQLVDGTAYVWPTADSAGDKLVLTMDRTIQDIDDDTQTYDLPQEAMVAISYGLALQLEPEYPLDPNSFQKLKIQADGHKLKLLNYNREFAPTQFQMEWR